MPTRDDYRKLDEAMAALGAPRTIVRHEPPLIKVPAKVQPQPGARFVQGFTQELGFRKAWRAVAAYKRRQERRERRRARAVSRG